MPCWLRLRYSLRIQMAKQNGKGKHGDNDTKGKMPQTKGQDSQEKAPHSVKVPQLYKEASKILKKFENKEGSLKTLIYSGKYRNYGVMFGILSKLVNNQATVKSAIAASNLLVEQPNFDPHLAQVLTTQALSKGSVTGDCKPIIVFKEYEEKIKATATKSFSAETAVKDKDVLPRYVRVNTLVGSVNRVHAQLETDGFILENCDPSLESYDDFLERVKNLASPYYLVDYHIPELLIFPPGTPFWDSILYKKNVIILQDKASCLPVFLSDVQETSNVLDACAAPGNKTSHIAAKINNHGKVIAVEHDQKRFETMRNLLSFRQATCVTSVNKDFFTLKPANYADIEHIFVDPSCSSSGTRVHNDQVSKQRVTKLASLQTMLLKRALSFPSVKEVIYSTCSVYEEENEKVVDDVLTQYHEEFELANLATHLQGWKHFGHHTYRFGHKCLRTDISIDRCTGFFVAKFVRKQAGKGKKRKAPKSQDSADTLNGENASNLDMQSSETSHRRHKKGKFVASEESEVANGNTDFEQNNAQVEESPSENTVVEECHDLHPKKKKKSKKSRKSEGVTSNGDETPEISVTENESNEQNTVENEMETSGSSEVKKKKKRKKSAAEVEEVENSVQEIEVIQESVDLDCSEVKRKKKKHKSERKSMENNEKITALGSSKDAETNQSTAEVQEVKSSKDPEVVSSEEVISKKKKKKSKK